MICLNCGKHDASLPIGITEHLIKCDCGSPMQAFSEASLKKFKTHYYLALVFTFGFYRPKTARLLKRIADELGL
jgi:hypothetical protein